jgi:hypothetical protein
MVTVPGSQSTSSCPAHSLYKCLAEAGVERLVRMGADQATAVPAATRLRAFRREILSRAQPSGFSLLMSIPPCSGANTSA